MKKAIFLRLKNFFMYIDIISITQFHKYNNDDSEKDLSQFGNKKMESNSKSVFRLNSYTCTIAHFTISALWYWFVYDSMNSTKHTRECELNAECDEYRSTNSDMNCNRNSCGCKIFVDFHSTLLPFWYVW